MNKFRCLFHKSSHTQWSGPKNKCFSCCWSFHFIEITAGFKRKEKSAAAQYCDMRSNDTIHRHTCWLCRHETKSIRSLNTTCHLRVQHSTGIEEATIIRGRHMACMCMSSAAFMRNHWQTAYLEITEIGRNKGYCECVWHHFMEQRREFLHFYLFVLSLRYYLND